MFTRACGLEARSMKTIERSADIKAIKSRYNSSFFRAQCVKVLACGSKNLNRRSLASDLSSTFESSLDPLSQRHANS
jgi:hypothetical protein